MPTGLVTSVTAVVRLQQHVVQPGRVAFKARPLLVVCALRKPRKKVFRYRLCIDFIFSKEWTQTANRFLFATTKTSNPEYPGNIDFCGLQPLASGRLRFLPIDANATVEVSLQNAFAPFVCFLLAPEGEKITTGSCGALFLTIFLLQTM